LLWFRKDNKNMFSSVLVSLQGISKADYQADNRKIHQLIKSVLKAQGVPFKAEHGEELIDGLRFRTFTLYLYNKAGKVVATQKQFKRFFDDRELSITLSFGDMKNGKQLQRTLHHSEFAR
jgi:hypothetical protein